MQSTFPAEKIEDHRKSFGIDNLTDHTDICFGSNSAGMALSMQIFIDNVDLGQIVNKSIFALPKGFLATIEGNGVYLISEYDCECDQEDHNAFLYVEVEHKNDEICWLRFFHYYSKVEILFDDISKSYMIFDKKEGSTNRVALEHFDKGIIDLKSLPFRFSKRKYISEVKQFEFQCQQLQKIVDDVGGLRQEAALTRNSEVLDTLASSPFFCVRRSVSINDATLGRTLEKLAPNATPKMLKNILVHRNTPDQLFGEIKAKIKEGLVPAPTFSEIKSMVIERIQELIRSGVEIRSLGGDLGTTIKDIFERVQGLLDRNEKDEAEIYVKMAEELLTQSEDVQKREELQSQIYDFRLQHNI